MNPNEDMVRQMAELSAWNAKHIAEIDALRQEIAQLKHELKQRDCIACNSFQSGTGWCDRHKAMLVNGKP